MLRRETFQHFFHTLIWLIWFEISERKNFKLLKCNLILTFSLYFFFYAIFSVLKMSISFFLLHWSVKPKSNSSRKIDTIIQQISFKSWMLFLKLSMLCELIVKRDNGDFSKKRWLNWCLNWDEAQHSTAVSSNQTFSSRSSLNWLRLELKFVLGGEIEVKVEVVLCSFSHWYFSSYSFFVLFMS